jgi:hypothetical protein
MDIEELRAVTELLGAKIADTLADRLIAELPRAIAEGAEAHAHEVLARNREAEREQVLNGQQFAAHLENQQAAWRVKEAQDRLAAEAEEERRRRELDLRIRIGEESARTGLPVDLVKTFTDITGGESLDALAPKITIEDAPQQGAEE